MADALLIDNPSRKEFGSLRTQLRELYLAAYRAIPRYQYAAADEVEPYLDWLYEGDTQGFYVAKSGASLVGFAVVHRRWEHSPPDVAELHELMVDPKLQGQGIGSALLKKSIEYARGTGQAILGLWVGEKNERAIQLYQRFGFKLGRQWRFWLRMELVLK